MVFPCVPTFASFEPPDLSQHVWSRLTSALPSWVRLPISWPQGPHCSWVGATLAWQCLAYQSMYVYIYIYQCLLPYGFSLNRFLPVEIRFGVMIQVLGFHSWQTVVLMLGFGRGKERDVQTVQSFLIQHGNGTSLIIENEQPIQWMTDRCQQGPPHPVPTGQALSNRTTSASSRRDKAIISLASCTRKSRDNSCAPCFAMGAMAAMRNVGNLWGRKRECLKPNEGCSPCVFDEEYECAGKSFPCLWI